MAFFKFISIIMDLGKIKNLVKHNGDKFIFIENGEPEMVVMSFQEYQRLAAYNANDTNRYANRAGLDANTANDGNSHSGHSDESGFFGSEKESSDSGGLPVRLEDIRLEDLPI